MQTDALPLYSVRTSKKARYLQLRIQPTGLWVIVPAKMRLSVAAIEQFIVEKKEWIAKHAALLATSNQLDDQVLPDCVMLLSENENWRISYRHLDVNKLRLKVSSNHQIILEGSIFNKSACITLLKRWIKQKALQFLVARLQQLSIQVGLPFDLALVRDMKSRWGSCSSQKKITLCANLIFLPIHLVDHVLLHELCHTKYMSHGKRFWSLLMRLDQKAKKHNRELRSAATYIPTWVFYK